MRFKIDWASVIFGSKFTVFALFYFVFEVNFPSTSPGGLYLEGRFNGGFFCVTVLGGLYSEGLIHGGANFRNFTVYFFFASLGSLLSNFTRANAHRGLWAIFTLVLILCSRK